KQREQTLHVAEITCIPVRITPRRPLSCQRCPYGRIGTVQRRPRPRRLVKLSACCIEPPTPRTPFHYGSSARRSCPRSSRGSSRTPPPGSRATAFRPSAHA